MKILWFGLVWFQQLCQLQQPPLSLQFNYCALLVAACACGCQKDVNTSLHFVAQCHFAVLQLRVKKFLLVLQLDKATQCCTCQSQHPIIERNEQMIYLSLIIWTGQRRPLKEKKTPENSNNQTTFGVLKIKSKKAGERQIVSTSSFSPEMYQALGLF